MAKKPPHKLRLIWAGMKRRCNVPTAKFYENYGGRGIFICARWLEQKTGFLNFVQDMGQRPDGYTIDRIDNNGPYSPENCRWATKSEQQLNRRNTRKVTIQGVEHLAWSLAKRFGLKADTIIERAKGNLTFHEVTSKEKRVYKPGLALGGKANGARQKAKTHCPHGHEYTPENIMANKDGFRRCKTCHREKEAQKRLFSKLL